MMNKETKFYTYHTLFAILGGIVVIDALLTTSSDGFSYPLALVLIGGSGMILTAAYKLLTADPSTFVPEDETDRVITILGSGALLALLGLALQLRN